MHERIREKTISISRYYGYSVLKEIATESSLFAKENNLTRSIDPVRKRDHFRNHSSNQAQNKLGTKNSAKKLAGKGRPMVKEAFKVTKTWIVTTGKPLTLHGQ
jgi:hypothetical protein